jgi:hypothetical protein
MTLDLYGHLVDRNLWEATQRVGEVTESGQKGGGTSGAHPRNPAEKRAPADPETLF